MRHAMTILSWNDDSDGKHLGNLKRVEHYFALLPLTVILSPRSRSSYRANKSAINFVDGGDGLTKQFHRAIDEAISSVASHCVFVDFDRLIHWLMVDANEFFLKCKEFADSHTAFSFFGRSPAYMQEHIYLQVVTESNVNEYVSDRLGKRVDCLSGAYGIAREVLEHVSIPIADHDRVNGSFHCFSDQRVVTPNRLTWKRVHDGQSAASGGRHPTSTTASQTAIGFQR
jgi:hypothetical protein